MISQDYIWNEDAPLLRFPPPEVLAADQSAGQGIRDAGDQRRSRSTMRRVVWDDTWRSFAWKRRDLP